VQIRSDRFQAFVAGRSLELTRREFELIELLAGGEGRVLEREEIYSRLWGYAMVRGDRSVDVFVRKLRQKLEKASPEWRYIHTHFGIGYRFAAERHDAQQEQSAAPAEQTGSSIDEELQRGSTHDGVPSNSADGEEPRSTREAVGLDAGGGELGDQGKLDRAQQEYELSTTGA
jgi:DNA-binding winged helix-turn-helix (wHTH) protein